MTRARILLTMITILLLAVSAAQARMVAVTTHKANIRETPKINRYNLFLETPRFYPLRVISKQGEFYQVQDFQGRTGWISDSIVDDTRTAVVKVKRGNLRAGPGTESSVVLHAEKGVCFKVLRVKGPWVQLEHESGQQGWMHSSLLWGL